MIKKNEIKLMSVIMSIGILCITAFIAYMSLQTMRIAPLSAKVNSNIVSIRKIQDQNNFTEIQKILIILGQHEKILNEINLDVKKIIYHDKN